MVSDRDGKEVKGDNLEADAEDRAYCEDLVG